MDLGTSLLTEQARTNIEIPDQAKWRQLRIRQSQCPRNIAQTDLPKFEVVRVPSMTPSNAVVMFVLGLLSTESAQKMA